MTDTFLKPRTMLCRLNELADKLMGLTQQELAAIHVQTGTENPGIRIFTLPDMPVGEKTRFVIPVDKGYAAIARYAMLPNKTVVIATDKAFNFGKYENDVVAAIANAMNGVKNAKTLEPTVRLHLVADLGYAFYRVNGVWIRVDGTIETNVRFIDYNPKTETVYGIRRNQGRFNELVAFPLTVDPVKTTNKVLTDIVFGKQWNGVAYTPNGAEFVNASKVHVENKSLALELDFDDGTTRGLTVTADGQINWTAPLEYGVIGRFFTGGQFGIITRQKDGFSIIPPEIVPTLPGIGQRYQTTTTA